MAQRWTSRVHDPQKAPGGSWQSPDPLSKPCPHHLFAALWNLVVLYPNQSGKATRNLSQWPFTKACYSHGVNAQVKQNGSKKSLQNWWRKTKMCGKGWPWGMAGTEMARHDMGILMVHGEVEHGYEVRSMNLEVWMYQNATIHCFWPSFALRELNLRTKGRWPADLTPTGGLLIWGLRFGDVFLTCPYFGKHIRWYWEFCCRCIWLLKLLKLMTWCFTQSSVKLNPNSSRDASWSYVNFCFRPALIRWNWTHFASVK